MRKTLFTTAAMILAVYGMTSTGMVTSASAQEVKGPKITLKFSLWGKRRAFSEGLEFISAEAKKRTGDNFNIRLYYGEQLSKSKENLDSISVGAIDAALFCAAYHPGKNKPLNVLDLPFLPLGNLEVMRIVHAKIYEHPSVKTALAKWNATVYMSNILPQYEYMGKGTPPASIADFKGKRLRALGGMGRAAKAIGAVPTTMPASETYTALQRGTVDAIGFPMTYTFSAYKLDEIADWVTTNMSLGTVNCPIVFNTKSYDKLPAQYKQLLEDLKLPASKAQAAAYIAKDKVNLAKWPKMMKMVKINEKEMAEFRRIGGQPLWDQWVKENEGDIPAQELLDLVLNTAKEASMKMK